MSFYIADYLADTTHLSTEQHGAYLLILFALWRRDGYLPDDERTLSKVAGLSLKRWRATAAPVMALLDSKDGVISSRRLLSELQKATVISKVRSDAAHRSVEARALKSKEGGQASADSLLEQTGQQMAGNHNHSHNHNQSNQVLLASAAPSPSKPRGTNRGSRWPEGQKVPEEWIEQVRDRMRERKLPLPDLDLEAERFATYWPSQPGQRGIKLNWAQTFYNWCLNAKSGNRNNNNRHTGFDAMREGAMRAAARLTRERMGEGVESEPPPVDRLALLARTAGG